MSKILLVAVNASYSHTAVAVRALYYYVKKFLPDFDIDYTEFTINQPVSEIYRGIAQRQPECVLFSTYIWNASIISALIPDLKQLLPGVLIGAGGPEFGYAAEYYLKKLPDLDFVMYGEGEETVLELAKGMMRVAFESPERWGQSPALQERTDDLSQQQGEVQNQPNIKLLAAIKGIYFLQTDGKLKFTGQRDLICDMDQLPFAYPDIIGLRPESRSAGDAYHKIYYYESSRGCPYSCAYCMSSLDKKVRFMPLERVFHDLQIFLDADIPLVKFVDRTFNLNEDRYLAIWNYILQHHNKVTMFHFEIEAEYLSDRVLDFLQQVPAGVMQFEIGVQSSNPKVLQAVKRSPDTRRLAANVKRIPHTIHQHLDLIAGLPYEDLESFSRSFDFVMDLRPDALQLGFLKVLHGTEMEAYAKTHGWKWMQSPAYETFSTPYMSYQDMLFLKDLEVLVDAYYNSGKFTHTMNYLCRSLGCWKFFSDMTVWAQKQGVFAVQRRESYWFQLLAEYTGDIESTKLENNPLVLDLLRYDFVLRGKQGGWPAWYTHNYDKNRHRQLLEENGGVTNARLDFGHSEYEVFSFDVDAAAPENHTGKYEKLIKY